MSDFLRLPWGGPEVGGVLFGAAEPDRVRILTYRPLECEHANGPAFELTEKDETGLLELIERTKTDQDLAGLQPVGRTSNSTTSTSQSPGKSPWSF